MSSIISEAQAIMLLKDVVLEHGANLYRLKNPIAYSIDFEINEVYYNVENESLENAIYYVSKSISTGVYTNGTD